MPSTPDSHLTAVPENPNSETRNQVTVALANPRSPEELIESLKLREQYGERIEGLKFFGLTNPDGTPKEKDAPVPSAESVIKSFNPEELQVAAKYKEPTLLLVPKMHFIPMANLLDSHFEELGLNDKIHFDGIFRNGDSEVIRGWFASIVEGSAQLDILEGDNIKSPLLERQRSRITHRLPGERGVDRNTELMLLMELLRLGKSIDGVRGNVVLDSDYETTPQSTLVALYIQAVRRFSFLKLNPKSIYELSRFRSSVGGNNVID